MILPTPCLLTLLLCALLAITPGCSNDAVSSSAQTTEQGNFTEKGVQEAKDSISKDVLILKQYPPLPSPPGHDRYVQLLKTQCGVTWESLSSDHPGRPEDIRAEVRAWNETMEAEIRKRFGEQIFSDLQEQAKAGRQAAQGGNSPSPTP